MTNDENATNSLRWKPSFSEEDGTALIMRQSCWKVFRCDGIYTSWLATNRRRQNEAAVVRRVAVIGDFRVRPNAIRFSDRRSGRQKNNQSRWNLEHHCGSVRERHPQPVFRASEAQK